MSASLPIRVAAPSSLTAVSGRLSDTYGRRASILVGFCLALPWRFAVGIMGAFAILGVSYGPMASFIPEVFETRFRYTDAGLAFNLGGMHLCTSGD